MDGAHDGAGVAVEAVLGAVVADAGHHVAHDLLHVHVGLSANLASDEHGARGGERLAGAAHLAHVGRLAARRDVALGLELGFLGQDGVQHRVGDLVAHLVRVAFGHRFGGEYVGALRGVSRSDAHGSILSSSLLAGPPSSAGRPGWCRDRRANSLPRLLINKGRPHASSACPFWGGNHRNAASHRAQPPFRPPPAAPRQPPCGRGHLANSA